MIDKKIFFIVPSLNKGGAERVVSLLSNFLSCQYNVKVISFSTELPQYDLKADFVSLNSDANKNIFIKLINIFVRLFYLRKFIKRECPVLIISFMESANIPAILATRFLNWNGSLMVSVRNNPSTFPWYYRIFIKLFYGVADNVVAPSKGICKELERLIYNYNRIDFIPNPIELEDIKNQSKQEIDSSLTLPKHYILAVGRLTHQKGFDRLISIFSKIRNTDINLVILGEGELRQDLNSLIQDHGLEEKVYMPGLVDNPFPIYRNAICLALTSRYEGWPNVINESLASGCPVVSYNCNYGPSEILDCDNGFLVEENDEEVFVEAISTLYEGKEVRDEYVSIGLKSVAKYSVDKIAMHWLKKSGLDL